MEQIVTIRPVYEDSVIAIDFRVVFHQTLIQEVRAILADKYEGAVGAHVYGSDTSDKSNYCGYLPLKHG